MTNDNMFDLAIQRGEEIKRLSLVNKELVEALKLIVTALDSGLTGIDILNKAKQALEKGNPNE